MTLSILSVAAVSLVAALLGLLAAGARWGDRRGFLAVVTSFAYYGLVLAPAYAAGEYLWRLPSAHLATGVATVGAGLVAIHLLFPNWNPPGRAFFSTLAMTCGAFIAVAADLTFSGSLAPVAVAGSSVLLVLELFAVAMLLVGTHEVLDVLTRVRWHRTALPLSIPGFTPFVSVQVATHNEPPDLVIQTLESLKALDYPAYEVLVLDNNTEDPALWTPIADYCERVGFRFVHLENWPGFKAGALNHAMEIQDPRTEIIAVVDADFIVKPTFLKECVGYFANPKMGIVQTRQSFRTDNESNYLRRLALSYRAFDEVTMPGRNERNAIIFAGTMGLIRASAIREAGGWAQWCVTEDAELSLRILGLGYQSLYCENNYGSGVVPLTFAALKKQRFRWCFGGIQLLRRHWKLIVSGKGIAPTGAVLQLSPGQRYDYLVAGLQWFQSLMTMAFSFLLLTAVATKAAGLELALRPLAGWFVAVPFLLLTSGLLKSVWGLKVRLRVTYRDVIATFAIWLSLTWAVALGCVQGLAGRDRPFMRTPKFNEHESLRQALKSTRFETPLAIALTGAAVVAASVARGADAVFLTSLAGWSAFVFWTAPVTAFVAAHTEVASPVLRARRRIKTMAAASRVVARPVGVAAVAGVAAVLVGLAWAPAIDVPEGGAPGVGTILSLPQRPPDNEPSQPRVASDPTSAPAASTATSALTPAGGVAGTTGSAARQRRRASSRQAGDNPGRAGAGATAAPGASGGSTAQPAQPSARPTSQPQPEQRPSPQPEQRPTSQPQPEQKPTSQPEPEQKPTARPGGRPTPAP